MVFAREYKKKVLSNLISVCKFLYEWKEKADDWKTCEVK